MGFKAAWIQLVVVILSLWQNHSMASDPSSPIVRFDIPSAIACREIPTITTKSMAKLVEAAIPLSANVSYPEDKFQSLKIELVTFERMPRIVDFLPKETLVAATKSGIAISESDDGRVSYANVQLQVRKTGGSVGVDAETKGRSIQRTYTLPMQNVVLATSGTLERGAGIWFKLERTAEQQLEKQHMLYVIFEVDQTWRCDAVRCAVQGITKGGEVCGESVYYLGLFLDGDVEAKERANNLGLNKKYEQIVDRQRKIGEIEGYLTYPQFGYGSMAERERIKVKSLQKEFDDQLADLRRFRLK